MEIEEYRLMFELEETHWWYRGLHDLLFSTIQGIFNERRDIRILDAGCGTGFILRRLDRYKATFGIDISEIALRYCRQRGLDRIARSSVSVLPFPDEVFDLIISTDVVYHKQVKNDIAAINEIYRVLKKEGFVIINLPAHDYLRRAHDERVHTRHRYAMNELRNKLEKCGLKVMKISYRNAFSFPALLLSKLINKDSRRKTYTDMKFVIAPINLLLYSILKMENLVLKGSNIPFGTSIFCISKKP